MADKPSASVSRVAIYARQSILEDQGIEQQLADCRKAVEERSWRVFDEFVDNKVSGSKERGEATQWAKMLQAYDDGLFDVLMIDRPDRFSRRLTDLLDVRETRDVRVVSARGGVDTDHGDVQLGIQVVLAKNEVREKTIRAKRYAVERHKQGHPNAGAGPHGYRWVPAANRDPQTQARYEIDEDEAEDVRFIFSEFLADPDKQASMKQIARALNDKGRRTRRGTKWGASTIRRMLMNPYYAGLLPPSRPYDGSGSHHYNNLDLENCITGAWEPIITEEQLRAARGKLSLVKPNHDGTARKWLLPGLATCGKCSGPVRSSRGTQRVRDKATGKRVAVGDYHAYRCATIGNGCFQRAGDLIDEFIAQVVIERLATADLADLLAIDDGPDFEALFARQKALDGREGEIALMIARGQLNREAAEPALEEIRQEQETVKNELARAVKQDPLAELAGVDDVEAWWNASTLARQRAIVGKLMDVVIHPIGGGRRTTAKNIAETVEIRWKD